MRVIITARYAKLLLASWHILPALSHSNNLARELAALQIKVKSTASAPQNTPGRLSWKRRVCPWHPRRLLHSDDAPFRFSLVFRIVFELLPRQTASLNVSISIIWLMLPFTFLSGLDHRERQSMTVGLIGEY
jgi:hypothetical protein